MAYAVKTYMDRTFPTIDVESTVHAAAQIIAEGNRGFVVVLEKGLPKGIVSSLEIVSRVVAGALDTSKVKVREVMMPLVTVDFEEDLMKASEIMLRRNLSWLAVVKDGIICGVVTAQGIAERCPEYVDWAVKDIFRWSFHWK